jgi:hypothetical protein
MKARWLVASVLLLALAAPAGAGQGDRIVRVKSGLNGWSTINSVCDLLGCTVLGSLDSLPGQTQPSSLFLVRGLLDTSVSFLLKLLGIAAIEVDLPVGVATEPWQTSQATAAVLDRLWNRTPVTYYGTDAWSAYVDQPAAEIVRVRDTHCGLRQTGAAIVAVIDTGVDPDHPTLRAVLAGGYDFTRNTAGGNEMADLGQATAAVLDGNYWVQQATAAVLDQATAAVLDDTRLSAFGHGTMVAGAVHLVAPTARIMPLKAFGADGQGYTSNILRAIHYAVQRGAKVINMSFSRPTSSQELRAAIQNATDRGVIAVASAGNDGQAILMYPAAYSNVIGVASTSNDDVRSTFSNHGANLVWLAAPGEGIITTYPWGSFAAAWGTSFSAPLVSGAAALIANMQGGATQAQVASLVAHARPLTPELGNGRLDLYQVVAAARGLWPNAPNSVVPATCEAMGRDWAEP